VNNTGRAIQWWHQAQNEGDGRRFAPVLEVEGRWSTTGWRRSWCAGPTCQWVRREATRVFWAIQKYVGLRVGPRVSKTYKMTWIKEEKNCNDKFQNRWIVMAYLRISKIVMARIKKPLRKPDVPAKNQLLVFQPIKWSYLSTYHDRTGEFLTRKSIGAKFGVQYQFYCYAGQQRCFQEDCTSAKRCP